MPPSPPSPPIYQRDLETLWPEYVNSSGDPANGTKLSASLFNQIRTAIEESIYEPTLSEGPPDIALELVQARGSYNNLDARLDAITAAAAGGGAYGVGRVHLNLVWNDCGLFWGATEPSYPDGWTGSGFSAVSRRVAANGGSPPADVNEFAGEAVVKLVNPSGTNDFYFDIITAAQLSSLGRAPLKAAAVGAGAWVYSSAADSVQVIVSEAEGTEHVVGANGSTVNQWVWTGKAVPASYNGGCTLTSSPSRLRLIIRITGNVTVYVGGVTCGFGESCQFYVPAPVRRGQILLTDGIGAQIATGDKASFYPQRNLRLISGRLRLGTAGSTGATTFEAKKGASAIFGGNITCAVGVTETPSWVAPTTVFLGTVSTSDVLTLTATAADAAARNATLMIRYAEPLVLIDSLFGG